MSLSLPEAPNLEQLRKQAKELVRAHRSGDAAACDMLRRLGRFKGASDEEILAAEVSLSDAQHAMAAAYGFDRWSDLKHRVESAVGAPGRAEVRRENGRVWIEDVPELRWGHSGECTFAGALAAALAVTTRPVSYGDLMGYSGLAFRIRWYRRFDEPDWCPSSPVGEFSEEIETVARPIGWRMRQESEMGKDRPAMERFAPAIRESIDAGRPVVGYPDKDLNVAVAYGYEDVDGRTTFLWNAYGRPGLRITAQEVGPWLMILEAPVEPMERTAALAQALATPNWRRTRLEPWNRQAGQNASYLYGRDAFEQWRQDIGQAGEYSLESRKKLFFVSWWCFDCLENARHTAARFLNDRAGELQGEARSTLAQAAGIYGQMAWKATEECFDKHNVFLGPWSGKTIDDWTEAVRTREQEILAEMERADSQARSAIDRALAAITQKGRSSPRE